MIDTVFISDLHLHPQVQSITERFNRFVVWAKDSVKTVYILGDFFHAWAGDDSLDEWSMGIATQLRFLTDSGVSLYYLHGNRDFLLGTTFAVHAGWTVLSEPVLLELGSERVLLSHGDRYCTKDKAHQRFRKLTRNTVFISFFLSLPLGFRQRLVHKVRTLSQNHQSKAMDTMDVVTEAVVAHMNQYNVRTLIHGHTHKPGLTQYTDNLCGFNRYVLSDWDDNPLVLCYDNTRGFYFKQFFEE